MEWPFSRVRRWVFRDRNFHEIPEIPQKERFSPNFRLRNLKIQSQKKCNSIPPAIPYSHLTPSQWRPWAYKISTFGITWCDHFWPNLRLEAVEGFHIKWWMLAAHNFVSEETKGRFRKRVVWANVPSFRVSFGGNMRTYPRPSFRSGGTSECTLVRGPDNPYPLNWGGWGSPP